MASEYINMVKLLFENVEACVCFDGSIIKDIQDQKRNQIECVDSTSLLERC